jgi:iron(III) transport system substrate-binding protein
VRLSTRGAVALFAVFTAVASQSASEAATRPKATKKSAKATTKVAPKTTTKATTTQVPVTTVDSNKAAWETTLAAAKKEGKVTLYTAWQPIVMERVAAAWKKTYPDIQLEMFRVLGEMDAKLEAERTTGAAGADVASHVNYGYATKGQAAGYWASFAGPALTSKPFAGSKWVDDNNIFTPVLSAQVIAYNTNYVRTDVKSYKDLLKRDWAGGAIGFTNAGFPAVSDFYAWLEDTYGADYLPKLAAQKPVFYASAAPLDQALIAGEIVISGYSSSVGVLAAIRNGAPIKYIVPESAWGSPFWTYVPKWSKRPNAAQVLVNWMASPEGQTVLGEEQFSPTNVKGALGPVEKMTPTNVKRTLDDNWVKTFFERWKMIFGR